MLKYPQYPLVKTLFPELLGPTIIVILLKFTLVLVFEKPEVISTLEA
jgi:hypothetical protein